MPTTLLLAPPPSGYETYLQLSPLSCGFKQNREMRVIHGNSSLCRKKRC